MVKWDSPMRRRSTSSLAAILEKPSFDKRLDTVSRDNEVIQHADIDQGQRSFEGLRQCLIGVARLGNP